MKRIILSLMMLSTLMFGGQYQTQGDSLYYNGSKIAHISLSGNDYVVQCIKGSLNNRRLYNNETKYEAFEIAKNMCAH